MNDARQSNDRRWMSLKDLGRRRFVAVTLNRVTEHDHPPQCYGCARPFGVDQAQPPLLHGYVTTTPYRRDDVRPGARLYWVCAPCFDEFKERLKFSTLPTVALDDLRRGPPMGPELG